jgi:hypothetical protein
VNGVASLSERTTRVKGETFSVHAYKASAQATTDVWAFGTGETSIIES